MAGEEQYYNPIIQAMIATAQQGQEKSNREQRLEELKQRAAEFQATNALAQKHLELQRAEAEQRAKHEGSLIDIQKAIREAAREKEHLENLNQVNEFLRNGGKPSALQQPASGSLPEIGTNLPGTPEGQVTIPGVGNRPISAFQTPEEKMNQLRQAAAAQSGGAAEGAEPFRIAEETRQLTSKKALQDWENEFKERIEDKKLISEEKRASLERNTQLAIANASNATHLKLGGMGPGQDGLKPVILSGILGQAKLDPKNPIERAAIGSIYDSGFRPLDPQDRQALQQMEALNPTFDKLNAFVNKYLPSEKAETSIGASASALKNRMLYGTPLPLDARNEMAEIKMGAVNIAKAIEGLTGGRLTQLQLETAINGLTDPGITKEQGLSRIQNLKDMYVNKQQNQIMGGMPAAQKAELYKTYGITPPELVGVPKVNLKGHKIDIPGSLQTGQPIYKQE